MTTRQISRRNFLKATTVLAGGAPCFIPSSALGLDGCPAPSNRVTVGAIGVGPQGNGVLGGFLAQPDVQVVAACDVNARRREQTRRRVELPLANRNSPKSVPECKISYTATCS